MNKYWLTWFAVSFTAFIVPETVALLRGRPQDTLSGAIWQMEQLVPGQGVWQWTAAHLLFTSVFIVLVLWLIGHFGWGLWR